jgi:dTDP-4-dehydrorhamnose 3,5-epimerase
MFDEVGNERYVEGIANRIGRDDPHNASVLPRTELVVVPTIIPGCFELRPSLKRDHRGFFAKMFHKPQWQDLGLQTEFAEEYITYSLPGTLRGLHFQAPPMAHDKVVFCLCGEAFDVAVDLRRGSPAYGKHFTLNLSSMQSNALYIPAGVAHGFCVRGGEVLLYYKLSTVYSPALDMGIHWDSVGVAWPLVDPIISERDRALPKLEEFSSPFTF